MMGDLSGRLASMLAAMPYAVAAKFAYSDRPVICTIGDGAFQMLGMNELITIKKYLGLWQNPQLKIMVVSASKERADAFSVFVKQIIETTDWR